MIETIQHNDNILAIIIWNNYHNDGVNFLTPENFSQQLAYISHKAGKIIPTHLHNKVDRDVSNTQEVLCVKKGLLRIDFYDENREYVISKSLAKGDVVLLASGGHGMEVIEDVSMIEIKQGPYSGIQDKTVFRGKYIPNKK